MKLTILALGSIKENWMKNGIGEYIKRLMPFAKVQIIERNESKMPGVPSQADKQRILEGEGEKILKYVGEKDCVVLLDLKGEKCPRKIWHNGWKTKWWQETAVFAL